MELCMVCRYAIRYPFIHGILISLLIIFLAAMFKAIADTVDHHFDTSIFRLYNQSFWNRDVSSEKAKRIFGYKIDAWHLALSAQIVCWLILPFVHEQKLRWIWELAIGGLFFNIVFNIFYNKILIKKKK